jgi:hypothetical protein
LPALSVIVPVYNGEEKLNPCVESILKQSNPDLELLLINDGSEDHSLEFCHQFERQDSCVTVYDKPHGGKYDCFNFGAVRARGDYLLFLPGESCLMQEAAKTLVSYAQREKADLLLFGEVTASGEKNSLPISKDTSDPKICELVQNALVGPGTREQEWRKVKGLDSPWRRLYRREWFLENHLHFFKATELFPPALPAAIIAHYTSHKTVLLPEPFVAFQKSQTEILEQKKSLIERYQACFEMVADFLKQQHAYEHLEKRHLAWFLLEAGKSCLEEAVKNSLENREKLYDRLKKILRTPLMIRAIQSDFQDGFSRTEKRMQRILRIDHFHLIESYFRYHIRQMT